MATVTPQDAEAVSRPGVFRRFWNGIKRIKHDLHVPLDGADQMSRWQRIGARFRFLFKRHGWKLVWSFIIFYLIRDTILYIIIPYLIARKVWG
jgi:hypothetical protein